MLDSFYLLFIFIYFLLFIFLFFKRAQTCQSHPCISVVACTWLYWLFGRKVPSERCPPLLPIEKCVLPLGQPSGNNITHTERSWCQGQLSCKDVGDGRHVLIFHFVGVSEHVAAGCGCNEADRRREAAPPARHPPAEEPPDTSRTINGRRTRRMAQTCPCFCTSGSPDGDDPFGWGWEGTWPAISQR